MTDTIKTLGSSVLTYTPLKELVELRRRRREVALRLGVTSGMREKIIKARTPYIDEFADRSPDPTMTRLAVKVVPNEFVMVVTMKFLMMEID